MQGKPLEPLGTAAAKYTGATKLGGETGWARRAALLSYLIFHNSLTVTLSMPQQDGQ